MNQNYRFMKLSQFCTPLHWAAHGVVGGTASALSGRKFANGAQTKSYEYSQGQGELRNIEGKIKNVFDAITDMDEFKKIAEKNLGRYGGKYTLRIDYENPNRYIATGGIISINPTTFIKNPLFGFKTTSGGIVPYSIERVIAHEAYHAVDQIVLLLFDGDSLPDVLAPDAENKAINSTNEYIQKYYPDQQLRDKFSHSCVEECNFKY